MVTRLDIRLEWKGLVGQKLGVEPFVEQLEPLSAGELDAIREFLQRPAFGLARFEDAGADDTVLSYYSNLYDEHPRYNKLTGFDGRPLTIGTHFFATYGFSNQVIGAKHCGDDPWGIFGDPTEVPQAQIWESVSSTQEQHAEFIGQLLGVVRGFTPHVVAQYSWHGHAMTGIQFVQATKSVAPGRSPDTRKLIFGETVELVVGAGRGSHLLRVGDEEIEIGQTEAEIFMSTSEARLVNFVTGQQVNETETLSDVLTRGLRRDLSCVFIDQTQFRNAMGVAQGEIPFGLTLGGPSPVGLLDLSSVLHQLIFADSIVVSGECEVPADIKGIVVGSVDDQEAIGLELYGLATRGELPALAYELDGLSLMAASWSEFLGRDVRIDYGYVDSTTPSPMSWSYHVGGWWADHEYDPVALLTGGPRPRGGFDEDKLSEAVSVQTWRYVLNERRAAIMGVEYCPSVLRYPAHVVALRNASHFRALTQSLFGSGRPVRHPGLMLDHFELPYALGEVLRRCSNPTQILPSALALREELQPFRERRWAMVETGESDADQLRSLISELGLDNRGYALVDTLVGTFANVATATGVDFGTALLLAKLTAKLGPVAKLNRFRQAIMKPELRVVRSFAQETAGLARSTADIERVFGVELNRRWMQEAAQLSDVSPYTQTAFRTFPAA